MAKLYRIRDWNTHYEYNNSKRIRSKKLGLRPCEMKDKYIWLIALPDGLKIYGAFNAILNLLHSQEPPRDGWLTHNGRSDGIPYAAKNIAVRTYIKEVKIIDITLGILSSNPFNWFEVTEIDEGTVRQDAREVRGKCAGSALKDKISQGKIDTDLDDTLSFDIHLLSLYQQDQNLLKRLPELARTWRIAYPQLNSTTEIAKAHAWETANPHKQKKDRPRFLNAWLSKAADNMRQSEQRQSRKGVKLSRADGMNTVKSSIPARGKCKCGNEINTYLIDKTDREAGRMKIRCHECKQDITVKATNDGEPD